jgi:AraC-like DNA-binding protein
VDHALRRARDVIDRECAEPLDLEAMAGEAGYSRFLFARAFTTAYGETSRTYLTQQWIEHAKTLLRMVEGSLSEWRQCIGPGSPLDRPQRMRHTEIT